MKLQVGGAGRRLQGLLPTHLCASGTVRAEGLLEGDRIALSPVGGGAGETEGRRGGFSLLLAPSRPAWVPSTDNDSVSGAVIAERQDH